MNNFNPNPDTSDIEMTEAVNGKTITRVETKSEQSDSWLVFHFTDGTSLNIRYDWIYGWNVK